MALFSMGILPIFDVSGTNWWLCHGQRRIRDGLSAVVTFALGRPPKAVMKMVDGSSEV